MWSPYHTHYVNVTGNPEIDKMWSLPSQCLRWSLRIILKEINVKENVCAAFRQYGVNQRLQELGRGDLPAEANLNGSERKM